MTCRTKVDLTEPINHRAVADAFLAIARGHLAQAKVNVRIAEMLITGQVPETREGLLEAAARAQISEVVGGMVR